jgi:hypothetical protein
MILQTLLGLDLLPALIPISQFQVQQMKFLCPDTVEQENPSAKRLPKGLPDDIEFNPGGLAVVWATNNSRKSIFQSLKSKEAYATSGPRYIVRFFGGEEIHEDSCELETAISSAYLNGVPMGGTLNKINSKPKFLISAIADQNDNNQYISSIQIIKSSYGGQMLHSEVIEVLDLSDSYQLDETSCMVSGIKKKELLFGLGR